MGNSDTSPAQAPALLVPRFVRGLELLAQKKGFAVSIAPVLVIPAYQPGIAQSEELHLVGTWRGTRRQFQSLRFAVSSFALPSASCTKAVIMNRFSPVRAGRVDVEGNEVLFTPDFGEVPASIEYRRDVEVAHYGKRITYHGTREALIDLGVNPKRLKVSKATPFRQGQCIESFGPPIHLRAAATHCVFGDGPEVTLLTPRRCYWDARLQPDGTILYRDDTELAECERRELEKVRRYSGQDRKASPDSEAVTEATYLDAAVVPLKNLSEIAGHFSKQLGMEVWQRIGEIMRLMQKERELLEERRRPPYLRLVVSNDEVDHV
jgi:hypothetical protein